MYRASVPQCAAFPGQNRKIVLQIQGFLAAAKETIVPGNHRSFAPNLYMIGERLNRGALAHIFVRHGITIGVKSHRGIPADIRIYLLGNVRSICRYGLEREAIFFQHDTDFCRPAFYLVVQILHAFFQQLHIQFLKAVDSRERDAYIAPDIADQIFHQPLLVAGSRIAENGLKSIMR